MRDVLSENADLIRVRAVRSLIYSRMASFHTKEGQRCLSESLLRHRCSPLPSLEVASGHGKQIGDLKKRPVATSVFTQVAEQRTPHPALTGLGQHVEARQHKRNRPRHPHSLIMSKPRIIVHHLQNSRSNRILWTLEVGCIGGALTARRCCSAAALLPSTS